MGGLRRLLPRLSSATAPADPMRLKLSGYAWTRAELHAFGDRTYAATKARMERCYMRVRRPFPMFAKIDAIDGDIINEVALDAPARLMMAAASPSVALSTAATARRLLLLLPSRRPGGQLGDGSDSGGEDREGLVITPPTTTTVTLLEEKQLKRCMRTIFYYKRRRLGGTGAAEEDETQAETPPPLQAVNFADAWVCDPGARTIEEVVFDPSRAPGAFQVVGITAAAGDRDHMRRDSEAWNNWPGILAAALPLLPPLGGPEEAAATVAAAAAAAAGVARIRAHITDVLFSGNAAHGEWCLDYLAVIVQRPWSKTGIIPLFTGAQGAGKNTIFDFFRTRILGDAISAQMQNPREGIFDRFGTAHKNRIFLQIDEADRLAACESELKNIVTADTMTSQRKFEDRVTLPNYVNLLMTTNSACPVRVSETERRFALFRVSDARVGDHAYFDALHAALDDAHVARAFYDLLMGRDITRFGHANLQASRPITPYFHACRTMSIHPLRRFLSACINHDLFHQSNGYIEVQAARLYQHYVAYFQSTRAASASSASPGNDEGRSKPLSQPFFGSELKNHVGAAHGIAFVKRSAGNFYVFDYAVLKAFLERSGEYDPDAMILQPCTQFLGAEQQPFLRHQRF